MVSIQHTKRILIGLGLLLLALCSRAHAQDTISADAFADPPLTARPGAYWCWLNGLVDHAQITREMEEAKAMGMRGFEIWDVGALKNRDMIPAGGAFLGEQSLKAIGHAMKEADRLGLELGIVAASSWNAGGAWVEKSDGSKRLASSSVNVTGPRAVDEVLPLACEEETYYRDVAVLAVPQSANRTLASLDDTVDLTGKMDKTGRLRWQAPKGDWTIMRFICRGTNQPLAVPSPNSKGLMIDHLSAGATRRHMMHMINKLGEVDPGHKILKTMVHDSYEVKAANDWTEDFTAEFTKRRRYDLLKYLPLLEGWRLKDADIQRRFIADYHKTVGELITERHFRQSREVLNRFGMQLVAEAGHGGWSRVDPLWAMGQVDIPRGEFWNGKQHWVTKEAACAANLYGKRYVEAESFTGWRNWLDGPAHYKQLFDVAICEGLNRVVFHTFTHNPKQAGLPGYAYHAGEHFNVNNTWWKQSGPMLQYMARTCYLMQQGTYVADVCFYYGDASPNRVPPRRLDPNIKPIYPLDKCLHCGRDVAVDFRALGSGYGFDFIDPHSIIERMTVDKQTGQLVVGKMRYRLMVLPDHDHINPDVLAKITKLIEQGATVLGSTRPTRTNTLTGYPDADARVAQTTANFWPVDSDNRKFGQGLVYTGITSRQALTKLGIQPDFTVLEGGTQDGPLRIDSIHRRTDDADVYFVCNSEKETRKLTCRFRDADGRAELWDPISGQIYRANVLRRNDDGSADIALELPAYGSIFVVFQRGNRPAPTQTMPRLATDVASETPLPGPWTVHFQPGRRAPESVRWPKLIDWTTSDIEGVKYFSGTATYAIELNMPEAAAADHWLNLGQVHEVAEVTLDGHDLGTAWTYPFRVRVPAKLLTKGQHKLQLRVTNVWNNRLLGDRFLDPADRVTQTNFVGGRRGGSSLVPSGLIGPVTLSPAE